MDCNMTYEIIRHIGTLSERIDKYDRKTKWLMELNIVAFNHRAPLYDLREWTADHSVMKNGIRLNMYQIDKLLEILEADKKEDQYQQGEEQAQ